MKKKVPSNGQSDFWAIVIQAMPQETPLANFKNWPSVRLIPIYELENEHDWLYTNEVIDYINAKNGKQVKQWKALLKEPKRGHSAQSYAQALFFLHGKGWETVVASGWTLKSAHHILTYESMSLKSILDFDQIVEIGPGIGETARMILDLGYKGAYHILDLPEIYRISSYYLADYPHVFYHAHYSTIPNVKKTLVIGTWSLSEVSFEYRNEIIHHFQNNQTDYFIIYQPQHFGYDNTTYFQEIFPRQSLCTCTYQKLDHLSTYLLAERT